MTFDTSIDPTGGEPGADTETTAVETPTMVSQPERTTRTYTDADMAGLRRAERERYDRQVATERERIRQEVTAQSGNPDAGWRARVEQEIQASAQARYAYEADTAISQIKAKYPDFEKNAAEIGKILIDEGIDRVSHYSAAQMLDLAYRIFDHKRRAAQPPVDIEAIKKQAADDALKAAFDKKSTKNAVTPPASGRGGAAPTSTENRDERRTRAGALKAAREFVRGSNATT